MIDPTPEMVQAFEDAAGECAGIAVREGLAAVLDIAERDLRAQIAYRIRAELVCCDIYEQSHGDGSAMRVGEGPHAICFWGEAGARIAEASAS